MSNAASRTVSLLLNDGVWTGSKTFVGPGGNDSGGNWSNPGNWSPAGVPTATDHVSLAAKSIYLESSVVVAGLTLSGGATLDLKDHDLLIDYTGASPIGTWTGGAYDGIQGLIATARNGGAWNSAGITTSRPAAQAGLTTLAAAEAAQVLGLSGAQTASFAGQTVDATTVLVKYTYTGDANLDGLVSGDDYTAIEFGIATPGSSGWANGDFNFDGIISGDDYTIIDFMIAAQGEMLAGSPERDEWT